MEFYNNNLLYIFLCLGCFVLQIAWVKFFPWKTLEIDKGKRICLDAVFCICTAIAVSTLFRLFPGNSLLPTEDSSVFLYIGKRMTEGKIPYRDFFDHKGPILYFVEYVGVLISKTGYTGVWLLEVFSILITILLMKKLGKVVSDRFSSVFLAVLASIGICGWKIWQGGNYSEEYALPWITLAAFVFFSFFQTKSYHKREIFLLGIAFAVVFLLRANMIAIWVALVPLVLICLIKEKRFLDIIKCFFLFAAGVATVLIPVLVYALWTESAEAMWQNYIVFNISYTDGVSSFGGRLKLALYFVKVLWPGAIAVIITLLSRPKKKVLWANFLFFIISLWFATMSGRGYYHYAIVLLPAFILPFTVLFDMTDRLLRGKDDFACSCRPGVIALSSITILVFAVVYRVLSPASDTYEPLVKYIQDHTSEEQDVLILGNSCWYYLMSGRKTENYYFYQLPPAEISMEIYNGFIIELKEHPSRLIVLPGLPDERESIDISLKGIRDNLFEMGYTNEINDEFEAFWLN